MNTKNEMNNNDNNEYVQSLADEIHVLLNYGLALPNDSKIRLHGHSTAEAFADSFEDSPLAGMYRSAKIGIVNDYDPETNCYKITKDCFEGKNATSVELMSKDEWIDRVGDWFAAYMTARYMGYTGPECLCLFKANENPVFQHILKMLLTAEAFKQVDEKEIQCAEIRTRVEGGEYSEYVKFDEFSRKQRKTTNRQIRALRANHPELFTEAKKAREAVDAEFSKLFNEKLRAAANKAVA